jgi:2-C-methyl-D-erythritol 2,4-cyclodiphosphate synthase
MLLRAVRKRVAEHGYKIMNVDLTIVAEAPKLAPYIEQMRENLAGDLGIDVSDVSVKATTTEGMGFAGREEGIAAHAVALLDAAV